ncbi:hypothetical protein WOLCODRAFT_23046 [Wolfiporia cocos MD-104 SS10]|uniref:DAGKc domain-containing protein n=1 Tax=Wolfiporia cocos (strain MD-104) TaxID=742152 RepID=A0A2H3JPU9_WOLCO|nr:hypothetical protein WOLCODRAFT_23046 [Wolfiporia cocos MD-104 SS10]
MDAAYAGIKRQRKLKVLVNPKSGPGNAISHYNQRVEPVFHAARCVVDSTFTSYPGHAQELMRDLDLDQYDAVVVVAGDGLIHEVINGFAEHDDIERAFRIPIAAIAGGSGNGMALNILGIQDGYDVSAGALNAVKGRPMHIDLCSLKQDNKKIWTFMSQTVGLFANLDIGTEWLRFLGSSRFPIGFVIEVIKNKRCPVKLTMKVVESDKKRMVHKAHASQRKAKAQYASGSSEISSPISLSSSHMTDNESFVMPSTSGPSARSDAKSSSPLSAPDSDGWVTFERPLSYVYAGKCPYVSVDLLQFPVALANDGLIDVVAQEITRRKLMLDAMDGSEYGRQYWIETQHYYKVTAYRVEPLSPKGCLAVDGEEYPFRTFEVECHRDIATVLSPYGFFKADFQIPDAQ